MAAVSIDENPNGANNNRFLRGGGSRKQSALWVSRFIHQVHDQVEFFGRSGVFLNRLQQPEGFLRSQPPVSEIDDRAGLNSL
jgi:hypothetical protein